MSSVHALVSGCLWQVDLARAIKQNLPPNLVKIIMDPDFKGSALIDLGDSKCAAQPKAKEISLNYPWILPMVKFSPDKATVAQSFVLGSRVQAPQTKFLQFQYGLPGRFCLGTS